MKKNLSKLLLFILSIFIFTACSKQTPEEKKAVDIANQAIKTMDSYLDFEIDANKLADELDILGNRLGDIPDDSSALLIDIENRLFNCSIYANSVSWYTVTESNELSESEKDLIDSRNNLAEIIGAKKR